MSPTTQLSLPSLPLLTLPPAHRPKKAGPHGPVPKYACLHLHDIQGLRMVFMGHLNWSWPVSPSVSCPPSFSPLLLHPFINWEKKGRKGWFSEELTGWRAGDRLVDRSTREIAAYLSKLTHRDMNKTDLPLASPSCLIVEWYTFSCKIKAHPLNAPHTPTQAHTLLWLWHWHPL